MMYRLIYVLFFIVIVNCSGSYGYDKNHMELIRIAVRLIERGNIDSLKTMVDTGYIYKLYSKEGFESKILLAHKQMKGCTMPAPSLYKIAHPLPQTSQYTLEFCRSKDSSITSNSFDLVFKFFDYKDDGLIGLLDVRNYARPTKANEPPPGL